MPHWKSTPGLGAGVPGPGQSGQASRAAAPAGSSGSRRGYLDWVRGIAVLVMIEAHVVDSWTAAPDRFSKAFAWAMVVGGFGAPLFLLLAGVAVSLSAGSKARRLGDTRAACLAVMRRGLEIFLLAFVFRIQAWILGWSSPRFLLRVDILNVMGPAIVMSAALWGMRATFRGRVVVFMIATLATTFLTPIVRLSTMVGRLPDPIEAYLRPVGSLTSFSFFPWAGFVFAGALLGVLLDAVRSDSGGRAWSSTEGRLNLGVSLGRGPPGGPGLRRLVPAYALRSVGLLDLFSSVLLPAVGSSNRGDWHFLRLGEATGRQGTMEPAPASSAVRRSLSTGFTWRWSMGCSPFRFTMR